MSCDKTKSLCNPYVFNTVVSRSKALVVAVGDPLQLMNTEALMGYKVKCWKEYLKTCIKNETLVFPEEYSNTMKKKMRKHLNSCIENP